MRYLITLCLCGLFCFSAFGQFIEEEAKPKEKKRKKIKKVEKEEKDEEIPSTLLDRLYFGGWFNIQFGNVTVIGLSPVVGYRLTPQYMLGVGLTYEYYKDRRFTNGVDVLGYQLFSRYYFTPGIFVHGEYNAISYKKQTASIPEDRQWFYSPLVGGGYFASFGGSRAGLNLTVLYNLNHDINNFRYPNPFIFRIEWVF